MTLVFKVKWIPPAGSLEGRSNELMTTPFFKPFIPKRLTVLLVKLIPGTSIPEYKSIFVNSRASSMTYLVQRQ